MGKTYIDILKYVIYADVKINGLVEKPDVVGAIFGQTEGLLGDELDLRELQKSGRIGRIQVDLEEKDGITYGTIKVPSSLDMVETCIIAGALETVDRIGPCDAEIHVTKVEDTRDVKRKHIIERAKELLKILHETELPESKEITELVRREVKAAEITEYGPEKLPAGPNIERSDSIILVEGRADVLNLLKNNINNVISLGGASHVPNSIVELSHRKEITVFLDGDRGGDLILKQLIASHVDIDYVARAPVGKEVEELSRKEMIKALRNKVPMEQYLSQHEHITKEHKTKRKERTKREHERRSKRHESHEHTQPAPEPKVKESEHEKPPKEFGYDDIMGILDDLENTLKTRFYDEQNRLIKEIPVRDMLKELEKTEHVKTIIFDGIITQRLVDLAVNRGVDMIVGIRIGNVYKKPETIRLITKP